ncbi:MAG: hypothetical protein PHV82_12130 [Victivallaceae bacterium]|nr:hypothetical protein [Victivallaceae bacterium]
MLKMSISVVVGSVKPSKEGARDAGYADFLFTGGTVNLSVNEEQLKKLSGLEGDNVECVFQMSPHVIVEFGRPACAFKIKKLITILGQGGK